MAIRNLHTNIIRIRLHGCLCSCVLCARSLNRIHGCRWCASVCAVEILMVCVGYSVVFMVFSAVLLVNSKFVVLCLMLTPTQYNNNINKRTKIIIYKQIDKRVMKKLLSTNTHKHLHTCIYTHTRSEWVSLAASSFSVVRCEHFWQIEANSQIE